MCFYNRDEIELGSNTFHYFYSGLLRYFNKHLDINLKLGLLINLCCESLIGSRNAIKMCVKGLSLILLQKCTWYCCF